MITKNIILSVTLSLIMSVGNLFAQQNEGRQNYRNNSTHKKAMQRENSLSEEQKEQIKTIHTESFKKVMPITNLIKENQAHYNTLMSAENIDIKAVERSVTELSKLKLDIANIKLATTIESKSILTEEQCLKMNMRQNSKSKMQGYHMKGKMQGYHMKGNMQGHSMKGKMQGHSMRGKGNQQRQHNGQGMQNRSGNKGNNMAKLNITDEQKAEIKDVFTKSYKSIQPLSNLLNENRAHFKTLMSASDLNKKELEKSVKQRNDLELKISLIKVNTQIAKVNVFTSEQRLMMQMHKAKSMKHATKGSQNRYSKGQRGHSKQQIRHQRPQMKNGKREMLRDRASEGEKEHISALRNTTKEKINTINKRLDHNLTLYNSLVDDKDNNADKIDIVLNEREKLVMEREDIKANVISGRLKVIASIN